MKKLLILLFSWIILTNCFGQKTNLALDLEIGKTYTLTTDSKTTIKQNINSQEVEMVMSIQGAMSFLVKSVESDQFIMQAQYESLSMGMEMPQGKMEVSSESKDPDDILSGILSRMKGQYFEVIMNKAGKIAEVNKLEALWEKSLGQFDQLNASQKEKVRAQIKKAYGEKAMKGSIEMVTAIYPDEPVNKGDQWIIETDLESGMSANMNTEYAFVESTSEFALIKGESNIKTADKDAYVEANGMPMKYDLTGIMNSEIKVDEKSGWILEATIYQKLSGEAHVKPNSRMPEGMTIPMTMITEMTVAN